MFYCDSNVPIYIEIQGTPQLLYNAHIDDDLGVDPKTSGDIKIHNPSPPIFQTTCLPTAG